MCSPTSNASASRATFISSTPTAPRSTGGHASNRPTIFPPASIARCWRFRARRRCDAVKGLRGARRRRRRHLRRRLRRDRTPSGRAHAGGDRAYRPRPRHGDRGPELPRLRQFRRRHAAHLRHDGSAAAARRPPSDRHGVAERRHGERRSRRARCARASISRSRSRPATRR